MKVQTYERCSSGLKPNFRAIRSGIFWVVVWVIL
jgi:hypothetical protein